MPPALRSVSAPVSESRSVPNSALAPKFQRSLATRLIPVGMRQTGQRIACPDSAPRGTRWCCPRAAVFTPETRLPRRCVQAVVRALVLQRVVQVQVRALGVADSWCRACRRARGRRPETSASSLKRSRRSDRSRPRRRARCPRGRRSSTACPARSRRRASGARESKTTCATASVRSPCSWVSGTSGEWSSRRSLRTPVLTLQCVGQLVADVEFLRAWSRAPGPAIALVALGARRSAGPSPAS